MANKKITFQITLDVKDGIIQTGNLTKQFDELKSKIAEADNQAKNFNNQLSQTKSKAGLAGAAVVEIGRTISDANYGMTAMANNLQQVSTLFVTLAATSGGFKNGLFLIRDALFKGPLGIIVGFQILFAVIEKFSMNSKKADTVAKELKKTVDALAVSTDTLTESQREQLKVSDKLTDNQVQMLLAQEMALDVERVRLEITKDHMKDEDELQRLLDEHYGRDPKDPSGRYVSINNQLEEYARRLKEIRRILREGYKEDEDEKGRRGKDQKWLYMPGEEATFDQIVTADFEALEQMITGRENWLKFVEEQTEREHELALQRMEDARIEARTKAMLWDGIGLSFEAMGDVIGRETEAGKFVAAAGALISTYAAIAGQLSAFAKVPIPGYAIAQAIATGAVGFAQVAQIYRTNTKGKNPSSQTSTSAPAAQVTPQFNIVGSSGASQLRDAVEGALDRPIQAYVTTKQIRSGEELERNTRRGASI